MDDAKLQQVKRLLKLGRESSNEAEANLALARAQELMAKYNLDAAIVEDTPEATTEKREKTTVDRTARYKWQKDLYEALAKANFCWYWLQEVAVGEPGKWFCESCSEIPNGRHEYRYGLCDACEEKTSTYRKPRKVVKRHMVLGSRANVAAVKLMGEYFEDTMSRICPFRPELLTHIPLMARNGVAQRDGLLWRTGCVDRLVVRIAEHARQLSELSRDAGDGKSLISLKDVAQQEYERNYDAVYGVGAWRRKLLRDEEWERQRAEREKKAEEERIAAEKAWLEYLQNESPAEKLAREKKEEKERLRERRRQEKANERYWASSYRRSRKAETDNSEEEAYRAGQSAADSIGLDAQLGEMRPAGRLA